jgi:hypothetical protein
VRFEHDNMVLLYGTAEASAPIGAVAAARNQATVTVTAAVQPRSPNHTVQIIYRVNGGKPVSVLATEGRHDPANQFQYFSAKLPPFQVGDQVDYAVVARSPAGQVPAAAAAANFPSSFHVVAATQLQSTSSQPSPSAAAAPHAAPTSAPSAGGTSAGTARGTLTKSQLLALAQLADSTVMQIQRANPALGKILAERIGAQLKTDILGSLKGGSKQLIAAVQKIDFSPSPTAATIEQVITSGLAAQKSDRAVLAEAARQISDLKRSGKFADLPDANAPIGQLSLFQAELNQAAVYKLAGCAKLADDKAQKLVAMAGSPTLLDDDLLAALVTDKIITAADATNLGLLLSLYGLTGGDTDLAIEIKPSITNLSDIAAVSVQQWLLAITRSKAVLPDGLSPADYSAALRQAATNLYPTEALHALTVPANTKQLTQNLAALAPLAAKNPKIFGLKFDQLDTSDVNEAQIPAVQRAFQYLETLVNQHPGLGIADLLNGVATPIDKSAALTARLSVLSKLRALNPDHEFMGLDYTEGSADRQTLQTTGLSTADVNMAIANFKAAQRLHALTRDVDHTGAIMAAGYASASAIAIDNPDDFERRTGLPHTIARHYHTKATSTLSKSSHAVISAIDAYDGPFQRTRAGNARSDIKDHLKAIPGFSDLFGSQDYCNCTECQSILGAAAYFVDLMTFVDENMTGRVFRGKKANDALNLKVRRPDLWILPLTCDNTNNLVSYLEIINPTLENYIAGQDLGRHEHRGTGQSQTHRAAHKLELHKVKTAANPKPTAKPSAAPSNRATERVSAASAIHSAKPDHTQSSRATERASAATLVYENILAKSQASFHQPFVLPLVKLDTYLEHFSTTRIQIARALAADQAVIVKAALKISDAVYQQLLNSNPDQAFLTKVYRVNFSFTGAAAHVGVIDIQRLLPPTGFSRADLETAINTRFVTKNGAYKIEIRSEKKNAESVQNDVEQIHELNADALHRLYRFTRLLRVTPWSISELDMILVQLDATAPPDGLNAQALYRITQALQLRNRWSLPVDQSCALWSAIPAVPKVGNLFDRLFNIAALQGSDPKLPVANVKFTHAAFSPTGATGIVSVAHSSGAATTVPQINHHNTTQRILAGLQVRDADLILLITALAGVLDANLAAQTESDLGFTLSLNNLTLLYRHACLTRLLRLSVPQLFQLIQLAGLTHQYVGSIDDLTSLLDFYDWYQASGCQLDDIGTIIQDSIMNPKPYPQPATLAPKLVAAVATDRSLTFADKVFTTLLGVTDAESQQMIAGNPALFSAVAGAATPTYCLTPALRPGTALQFSDTVLAFLPGITDQQSQQIVAANSTLFTAVSNATPPVLQLSAAFGPGTTITIPAGISLSSQDANAALIRYSAGPGGASSALLSYHPIEVIPSSLSGLLGIDAKTLAALITLTGVDLSSPQIFQALQAGAAAAPTAGVQSAATQSATAPPTAAPATAALAQTVTAPATAAPTTSAPAPQALAPATSTSGAKAPAVLASPAALAPLVSLIQQIVPLQVMTTAFGLSADDLIYILQNSQLFDIANFNTLSVANVRKLSVYAKFATSLADSPTGAVPLRDVLSGFSSAALFSKVDPTELATVLGIEPRQLHSLLPHLVLPATAPEALTSLSAIVALSKSLGIGGDALRLILSDDYSDQNSASVAVLGAYRAQFQDEQDFIDSCQPFDDRILQHRRDALTDYLLTWKGYQFSSLDDLYNYFLLDVQLEGCMQTSWVVAAISSVQLYVYRCLMNLEQDQRDPDDPDHIQVTVPASAAEEWKWRQNYRVWQANREVFLYPESYMLPELRDDKTPLFEDLQSALLQQPINEQNVLDAFSSYLSGLDQLSKLQIAGSYHDIDTDSRTDVLHLFGVTPADPPTFFYRTVENANHGETETDRAVTFTPWVPVNLQIHCREISPIVYLGRLFVFWTQISTAPQNLVVNANSIFNGYKHTWRVMYSFLRLDQSWTPPQQLSMTDPKIFGSGDGVVLDPLLDYFDKNQYGYDGETSLRLTALAASSPTQDQKNLISSYVTEQQKQVNPHYSSSDLTLASYQSTLIPTYGTSPQTASVDGYTLVGFPWDRVYPTLSDDASDVLLTGRNFLLRGGKVDFYNQDILPMGQARRGRAQTVLCSRTEHGNVDRHLYTGVQNSFPKLERYAWCSIVAKDENIQQLAATYESADLYLADVQTYFQLGARYLTLESPTWSQGQPLKQGLYRKHIATIPGDPVISVINSSARDAITDAIIDVDSDVLMLQGSVRPGEYVLKRLTTTLGEHLCRALFVKGVDGLLSLETQQSLREAEPDFSIQQGIAKDVVVGKMDFTGALGTYFQEVFFHTSHLIASQLNGQQNFEAAQQWYRYIFDPTASDDEDHHDVAAKTRRPSPPPPPRRHVPAPPPPPREREQQEAGPGGGEKREASAPDKKHEQAKPEAGHPSREQDRPRAAEESQAAARDRVWRFIDFRNQDVPSLRQILTDAAAIETYEQNPFNPYAIARLRLSAYQKCIVMDYVDNLINWGDALFTEFQMETVNEATLLYVQALEILGPRPQDVGDCGEMDENERTYERIAPLVKNGCDFLMEMETYSHTGSGAARAQPKRRPIHRFTLSHAVANHHLKEATNSRKPRVSEARQSAPVEERVTDATHDAEPHSEIRAQSASSTDTLNKRAPKAKAEHGAAHPYHWKGTHSASRSPSGGKAHRASNRRGVAQTVDGHASRFAWSVARHVVPVFCVPPNDDLLAYWDIVEDRLYKIRHGMDITGALRQLSLFAPPINPLLLVEATAAGLSLDDVINATSGNAPPYRFTYLIDKAKQFASQVQSLGNTLLSALEKRDAQQLEVLRVAQQQNILAMTTSTKQAEIDAASNAIDTLNAQLDTAQFRHDYFQGLIESGLNAWEHTESDSRIIAAVSTIIGGILNIVSGITHLTPDLGSPFAFNFGGEELGHSFSNFAVAAHGIASVCETIATAASVQGGHERRSDSWQHEVDTATKDITQITSQLAGANIRLTIANNAMDIHKKTIAQEQQVADFYTSRFTNVALYSWLASTMKTTYRQAYNCAFAMAQLAQQAYQFERSGDTVMLVGQNYWSQAQSGLLAGEMLLGDLQRLEQRFIETNYRTPEITQSFSMMQIAPAALLNLRQNATCKFDIPELAFDLVYPGHYCRKIKAVRLTIPCVAGPLTNVGATLTLTNSQLRLTATSASLIPIQLKHSVMIATSTAQNDSGVFEFSFRDERYMPYEGAGAISSWTVALPDAFRIFDYQTITDVIVHISYTSQYDGVLRQNIEQKNGAIAKALQSVPLGRLFSLRREFPTVLNRLLHGLLNTTVTMSISANMLPFFIASSSIQITRAVLLLRPAATLATVQDFAISINATSTTSFQPDSTMADLPSADVTSVFSAGLFGDFALTVTKAGNLAPAPPQPGDPSPIDDTKLLDVMLYVEYQLGAA